MKNRLEISSSRIRSNAHATSQIVITRELKEWKLERSNVKLKEALEDKNLRRSQKVMPNPEATQNNPKRQTKKDKPGRQTSRLNHVSQPERLIAHFLLPVHAAPPSISFFTLPHLPNGSHSSSAAPAPPSASCSWVPARGTCAVAPSRPAWYRAPALICQCSEVTP